MCGRIPLKIMKIRHLTYSIMLNFINQRAYFQRISYKFNEVLLNETYHKITLVCRVFQDDFFLPHETDIVLGCPFLDVQHLL